VTTRRKFFITGAATSLLGGPLRAFAQQAPKVSRVGILSPRSRATLTSDPLNAFPQAMREMGHVEHQGIQYEWRFGEGDSQSLPRLAAELVDRRVDVIVAVGAPAVRAAQLAAPTVPIVMVNTSDPVGSGFAASLARPGGNITGVSVMTEAYIQKHLELILAAVPGLSRLAVLFDSSSPATELLLKRIQAAAQKSEVRIVPVGVRTPKDLEHGFSVMQKERVQALTFALGASFLDHRDRIAELALKGRLPTVFSRRESVEAGGLMSYGAESTAGYRRAAAYVDKILKGARPGDIPIEQPTKIELVVNMKTAKALGITIPQSILVRADRVIE
jgi:putative ABC transport system substrate-binding protein